MSDTQDFVKIRINLENNDWLGSETIWAVKVPDGISPQVGLYRVANIPLFAYGIHMDDIVLAATDDEDSYPKVEMIIKESGHRTFRAMMSDSAQEKETKSLIESLKKLGARVERGFDKLYALDFADSETAETAYDLLLEAELAGMLSFETCENRIPGSFDDKPEVSH